MTEQRIMATKSRGRWHWTMTSGCLTLILGAFAFLLPEIQWMEKGGLVGWLLTLAGMSELAFGLARGSDAVGGAATGSGMLTAALGVFFIANPLLTYFPVVNLVMIWLFLRGGLVLIITLGLFGERSALWLGLTAITDILLAFALLSGLHISVLVVMLFGPTREIIAMFASVLGTSFLVTGISQIAVARLERAQLSRKLS